MLQWRGPRLPRVQAISYSQVIPLIDLWDHHVASLRSPLALMILVYLNKRNTSQRKRSPLIVQFRVSEQIMIQTGLSEHTFEAESWSGRCFFGSNSCDAKEKASPRPEHPKIGFISSVSHWAHHVPAGRCPRAKWSWPRTVLVTNYGRRLVK